MEFEVYKRNLRYFDAEIHFAGSYKIFDCSMTRLERLVKVAKGRSEQIKRAYATVIKNSIAYHEINELDEFAAKTQSRMASQAIEEMMSAPQLPDRSPYS